MLQTFLARGVQVWGQPVQDVLDDGHLLIQQAASQDGPGLVSMLLEVSLNLYKNASCDTKVKFGISGRELQMLAKLPWQPNLLMSLGSRLSRSAVRMTWLASQNLLNV